MFFSGTKMRSLGVKSDKNRPPSAAEEDRVIVDLLSSDDDEDDDDHEHEQAQVSGNNSTVSSPTLVESSAQQHEETEPQHAEEHDHQIIMQQPALQELEESDSGSRSGSTPKIANKRFKKLKKKNKSISRSDRSVCSHSTAGTALSKSSLLQQNNTHNPLADTQSIGTNLHQNNNEQERKPKSKKRKNTHVLEVWVASKAEKKLVCSNAEAARRNNKMVNVQNIKNSRRAAKSNVTKPYKHPWRIHPEFMKQQQDLIASYQSEQSLTLRVSTANPSQPYLIDYDQVEPVMEKVLRYENQFASFRHVLLSHRLKSEISARASTSAASTNGSHHDVNNTSSIHSNDDVSDRQVPHLEEWFPCSADETILNATEQELAWLFEECHHCIPMPQKAANSDLLRQSHLNRHHPLVWDFIWHYASPSLRVQLRQCEDTSDNQAKLEQLIRWDDLLVQSRMEVFQTHVRSLLVNGFRRLHMKRVIAVLRMRRRQQVNDDPGHVEFPEPIYARAIRESYAYTTIILAKHSSNERHKPEQS